MKSNKTSQKILATFNKEVADRVFYSRSGGSATVPNGLWHQIILNSGEYSELKPTVTDYMKALKRAMGKKEKPVYNSALKEALKKPTWR